MVGNCVFILTIVPVSFQNAVILGDDKTGSMNLAVRKQRQRTDLSEQEKTALDDILARTQSSAKVEIEVGEWHELRVRIKGDIMKAFLDGEQTASLRSPGIAHPTKTKFGFTVNGATIEFDKLRVLQATSSK